MTSAPFERLLTIVVAVATPIVIVAVAILLFLNPVWVGFEQDRTGVQELTGYSADQVRQATGGILSDLAFGPYTFDVTVSGQPVLDEREREHMADVANVFHELGAVALVAAFVLGAAAILGWRRRAFWEGAAVGSGVLVTGVILVGLSFALFFDQTFTLMHELFFAQGTWTFNSGTERLVQLFPEQFWSETIIAVALVTLALAVVAFAVSWRVAHRDGPIRYVRAEAAR